MRKLMAAVLVLAAAAPARAGEYHYNDVFLGARATGLGGTMIGLADDPSAAYYNPAGLAHARHETVSLGGSALLEKRLTIEGYLGSRLPVDSTSIFSPVSAVTSPFSSGRIAIVGFVPSQDDYRVSQTSESPGVSTGLRSASINRERSDDSYLAGIAFGREQGRDLDWGLGGYYVYRRYREQRSDFRHLLAPTADGSIAFQRNFDEQGLSHGALIAAGLLYHPGGDEGRFRLGVSVRTGVNVSTAALQKEEVFVGRQAGGGQVLYQRTLSDARRDGAAKQPPALGVGVAFRPTRDWVIAADGTVYGYVEYETFGRKVSKLATANASFGSELSFDGFAVRGGAFTNLSSAPQVADADGWTADTWDQYGVAAGCTFERRHNAVSLAAKLAWMRGTASLATSPTRYESLPVNGWELGLVLGSAYTF